jgi:dTDP-4-amino-4,6-dideoxygalactose transaminase
MIRVSQSCIGKAERAAASAVIEKGFLGMGPEVQNFEKELADYIGVGEVVAVNSGTAALHLALQALGIGPGDEVLVPSITYVATYQAITATGANAVSVDIDPCRGIIDLDDARKRLSKNTRAIVPVHYASFTAFMPDVMSFAREAGIRVVEDAAHSFGGCRGGKRIGAEGDIVCFSFDGIKNITSGEGGAVVTTDREVAQKVKDCRLLGVMNDSAARYRKERTWAMSVEEQGWRYHMSDIMAAIGRAQLGRIDELAGARRVLVENYDALLKGNTKVKTVIRPRSDDVPHIYPVLVGVESRDRVREELLKAGVQTGIHYYPNHLLSKFRTDYGLPTAELWGESTLSLPLHPNLTPDQQDTVAQRLEIALG